MPSSESVLDVNNTIREVKELVFAAEIARGTYLGCHGNLQAL